MQSTAAYLYLSEPVQSKGQKLLTQVVEILLEFLDKRDWSAALEKVIPQRKRGGGDGDAGGGAKRAKQE